MVRFDAADKRQQRVDCHGGRSGRSTRLHVHQRNALGRLHNERAASLTSTTIAIARIMKPNQWTAPMQPKPLRVVVARCRRRVVEPKDMILLALSTQGSSYNLQHLGITLRGSDGRIGRTREYLEGAARGADSSSSGAAGISFGRKGGLVCDRCRQLWLRYLRDVNGVRMDDDHTLGRRRLHSIW